MSDLISADVVNGLLPNFGITKPSALYERRIKGDQFKTDDVQELLEESKYVYAIDWRACLQDELEQISDTLSGLDVELVYQLNGEGNSGTVSVDGKSTSISFSPDADDGCFDNAMSAIASVLPEQLEVRASVYNGGNDTNCCAILPKEYWAEADKLASDIISAMFKPFDHNQARLPEKNFFARLRNFFSS